MRRNAGRGLSVIRMDGESHIPLMGKWSAMTVGVLCTAIGQAMVKR